MRVAEAAAVGEPVGVALAGASAPVLLVAAVDDHRVMTCPDIDPEVWRPIALILGST